MTPTEIMAAVDAKAAQLLPALEQQANTYAASHGGKFWQGLRTHTVTPAEGVESVPDVGTKAPSDQPTPWPMVLRNVAMPMAVQVDSYEGAAGVGYVVTLTVKSGAQDYRRVIVVGPETWRNQAWTPVPSGGVGNG